MFLKSRHKIYTGGFYLIALCLSGMNLQAQIDAPSASIEIKGKEDNEVPEEVFIAPLAPESKTNISSGTLIFKSKMKLDDPFTANKKREVFFTQGNDFAERDYTALKKKLNNDKDKDREKLKPDNYKNQNLGNFKSGSKFVNFVYRDHGTVDGDLVSVTINDIVVHPRIFLQGEFQGFYLDLVKGFNKIEVKALNQGSVGPNTAQFIMYDDERQVISSNTWALATGYVASVIIVKD